MNSPLFRHNNISSVVYNCVSCSIPLGFIGVFTPILYFLSSKQLIPITIDHVWAALSVSLSTLAPAKQQLQHLRQLGAAAESREQSVGGNGTVTSCENPVTWNNGSESFIRFRIQQSGNEPANKQKVHYSGDDKILRLRTFGCQPKWSWHGKKGSLLFNQTMQSWESRLDYCVLQTEGAQTLQHHNCRLHHYCEPQLADCADHCIMGQCLLPCEGIAW